MPNLAIEENVALKVLHKPVHSNLQLASSQIDDLYRLYMGIELGPLPSPIGADLLFSDNLALLKPWASAHLRSSVLMYR
jgi:hypothetical protein